MSIQLDFFATGSEPCNVLDGVDGILFVKKPDGRSTGDAFVLFANESDSSKALSRHRESIGQRYIELFRSTTAEVQQVRRLYCSIILIISFDSFKQSAKWNVVGERILWLMTDDNYVVACA